MKNENELSAFFLTILSGLGMSVGEHRIKEETNSRCDTYLYTI